MKKKMLCKKHFLIILFGIIGIALITGVGLMSDDAAYTIPRGASFSLFDKVFDGKITAMVVSDSIEENVTETDD